MKLDRTVGLHRRLADAASEAHQEIESSALRRSLLHGSSGFSSSSSSSPSSVCFSRHHRESSRKSRGALHVTEAAQQPGDDEDGGPELLTAVSPGQALGCCTFRAVGRGDNVLIKALIEHTQFRYACMYRHDGTL